MKTKRLTDFVTKTVLPGLHLYFLYLCLRGVGMARVAVNSGERDASPGTAGMFLTPYLSHSSIHVALSPSLAPPQNLSLSSFTFSLSVLRIFVLSGVSKLQTVV